ncbi:MAG: hypothetical protein M3442_17805, partial [Chloroflexota bacterium]|nr:hypothetical protein [Chloroflexota bacterium]
MEPEAPTRQTVQDQGDDLEFNYVADELCIVLSRAALPVSSLHEGDAEVPARALYDAVLDEMNRQLGGLLSQPASVKPSDGAGSSHLLRRLSAEPRLLAPLDRLPQPGFRAGADPSSAVVLPRRGNTRTALCFYSLPLGRSSPDRTGPPAPRQWSGPELAESVGVLVSGINRNRWQLRPVNVNGEAWHIRAATPNWLTATQGDHTGGGPGSRPTPVTRSQLQRQEGAASTAADERRWRFWFADKTLQSMVEHQHATAAAIEEPAGRQGEAPARTPGRVIVAVLDTSPEKSTVDSAAARYPDNWLLQDVSRNVIFDGDLVPAAGQPGQSPYAHLRYYVPNWRGGLGFWRRAYGGTETTRAHLDRRRHEHYAMPDHGLFVAGIIRDIAPTAEVHLIRVLDDAGVGDLATLTNTLRALPERLLSGANSGARLVVNLSLMVDVPQKDRLLRLRPGPAGWGAG